MSRRTLPALLGLCALIAGCQQSEPPRLLGTLERDRITLPAEVSEPIVQMAVAEGDTVAEGQLLLALDPARHAVRLAQAEAEVAEAQAALNEARNGTRPQTLDAARATLANAGAGVDEAAREYDRQRDLLRRGLTPVAERDAALTRLEQARALHKEADARLSELLAGTRPERVDQAQARLAAAEARRDQAALDLERLRILAPRGGRVDELPFETGDQPPAGATVVTLLVGERPYARVFVPAPRRGEVKIGDRATVWVQGVSTPFAATVRSIRDEPSFTPYYALSGDDANRLVYMAELVLDDDAADLPAGLPVTAEFPAHER